MNILFLSHSDTIGGAAVAARRLMQSLYQIYPETKMLVQQKGSNLDNVYETGNSYLKRKKQLLLFGLERIRYMPFAKSRKHYFSYTPSVTGEALHLHPLVQQADLLHLNWMNFGFMNMHFLKKMLALNKPIVWTLHDMWALTGGCHYVGQCRHFTNNCGNCPLLHNSHERDLSYKEYQKKKVAYNQAKIYFATSSQWLKNQAKASNLTNGHALSAIPTPIDTEFYAPGNKVAARKALGIPRDKYVLLFGAFNINDERKGIKFFIDALHKLKNQLPIEQSDKVFLLFFGKASDTVLENLPFPYKGLGFVSTENEMQKVYQGVDAFVIPSLEDNLPNTILESHATGIPVIGFDNAGISEMIDHKQNGYLAASRSSSELKEGIEWVLFKADAVSLKNNARDKALKMYHPDVVAEMYSAYYQKALKNE